MIWYRASFAPFSMVITPVTVVRELDATLEVEVTTINGATRKRRIPKATGMRQHYRTWREAHDALLAYVNGQIAHYRAQQTEWERRHGLLATQTIPELP